MATRSYILVEKRGKLSGVYCHWDGQPDSNGLILSAYFKKIRKIKKLLEHGDMSCLNRLVISRNKNNGFDNPSEDTCIFYHRDRGEKLNKLKNIKSTEEFNKLFNIVEYVYVFKNNKWYVSDTSYQTLTPLKGYF